LDVVFFAGAAKHAFCAVFDVVSETKRGLCPYEFIALYPVFGMWCAMATRRPLRSSKDAEEPVREALL
jgi:hypothetical protein